MKSLHELCKPRDSLFDPQKRDTVLDSSDLVDGRIDPADFFAENHITEGMKAHLKNAFLRMEGKSEQGVYKLEQATRLKTASEFARKNLSTDGFGSSLVRHVLFAAHQVSRFEQTSDGLNWMKTELPDYWNSREKIIDILDFLGSLDRVGDMDHWKADAESARLLAGTVRNDHV